MSEVGSERCPMGKVVAVATEGKRRTDKGSPEC